MNTYYPLSPRSGEPDRIPFLDGWRFSLVEDESAAMPEYDDAAFRTLNLPHDWAVEQGMDKDAPGGRSQGYFRREALGAYRIRFTAPKEWQDRQVRILFDGVQRFYTVFLNGRKLASQKYGYVPLLVELAGLKYGQENLLAVLVDNRQTHPEWINAGGDRWYSGAGIYRSVWLLVDDPSHFVHGGLQVTAKADYHFPFREMPLKPGGPHHADVTARLEIACPREHQQVRLTLTDDQGEKQAEGTFPAAERMQETLVLPRPSLWSPETPVLYTLRAELMTQGQVTDVICAPVGIREIAFDSEEGFLCNGQKRKMWGVNLHHDGGAVGAAVPPEVWRYRLESLKKLGVNTIRTSHNPMAEEFYDLCDEMGFFVVDEFCDKWQESRMYFDAITDEERLEDLERWIRRDVNHPSVVLWSVGNEINTQYSEYFFRTLKMLCDKVRALDPARPVTAVLLGFLLPGYDDAAPLTVRLEALKRYSEIVDVVCLNYMEQLYEKIREFGVRKPIIGTEVHMFYRHADNSFSAADIGLENPYRIYERHDWLCGALLWAGIDYMGESSVFPCRCWTGDPLDSTGLWKTRAWFVASGFKKEPVLRLAVYDESEPYDYAMSMWGFPQMRSQWRYPFFGKILHVVAITNCETVRLYQNSQPVRVAHRSDFKDGMVHFYVSYMPGRLCAEGVNNGQAVVSDEMYSDHQADHVSVACSCSALPCDGHSVALIDVNVQDAYGRLYELEDREVRVTVTGAGSFVAMDNGNAQDTTLFSSPVRKTHNGHALILVRAGCTPGQTTVDIEVEGFEKKTVTL